MAILRLRPYTKRKYTQVDDEDYDQLIQFKWNLSTGRYALTNITVDGKQRKLSLHRMVMKATPGQVVDHVNGDRLDNRRTNLRFVTVQQNQVNRGKDQVKRSSRYKGVCLRKKRPSCWVSMITRHGKKTYLGHFRTEYEAARMYDFWAIVLDGEYAKTNLPVVCHT